MAIRFYINPDQDIISVIHRLLSVGERRIILNIPPNAKITQDSISLRILKREAQEMEKEIMIVSNDTKTLKLAREAGLKTYQEKAPIYKKRLDDIPRDRVIPEKKPFAKKSPGAASSFLEFISGKHHQSKKEDTREKQTLARGRRQRLKPDKEKRFHFLGHLNKIIYLFLIVCLVVAGIVAYLVLPQAKIEILPKQELLTFELEVVANPETSQPDLSLNKIPGQLISVTSSQSQKFEATDENYVASKAKGRLRIYNNFNSQEQVLIATTRFVPEGTDLVFRIPQRVVVAGAKIVGDKIEPSFIEVEVVADQPGIEYNIGPATFKIPGFLGSPKYEGFYGRSLEPMRGGSQGQGKTVSEDDVNRAKESLTALLQEIAQDDLTKKIPANLKFLSQCQQRKLINLETSAEPGDAVENFIAKAEIELVAIVFDESDLKELVEQNILSQISDKKHSLPQTQIFEYLECQIEPQPQQARFKVRVQEKAAFKIDQDKLFQDLVDKDAQELENYFKSYEGVDKARVSFWPFWVKKIPNNKQNFELKIVYSLD